MGSIELTSQNNYLQKSKNRLKQISQKLYSKNKIDSSLLVRVYFLNSVIFPIAIGSIYIIDKFLFVFLINLIKLIQ